MVAKEEEKFDAEDLWKPKTLLGKKVKAKEITDIKDILDKSMKISEPEIVDRLLPELDSDMVLVGQAKGKFGGGKRRLFKQTQKKSREGNKPIFTAVGLVGNNDGYVGMGLGAAKETLPSKEKALRNARLKLIQVARGCGSWECGCGEPHSLPFEVSGGEGSVRVVLMPAPKGTGLVVDDEIKKLLRLAGIKDVWGKTFGQTRKKINLMKATFKALKSTVETKSHGLKKIVYGPVKK